MMKQEIFQAFLQTRMTFDETTLDELLDKIRPHISLVPGAKKIRYINLPISFDTEFSSFRDTHGEKVGLLYAWMLGVCGLVVMGRDFDSLLRVYDRLCEFFRTCGTVRVICYVHFLGADFEYIRKHFEWGDIFAMEAHDPVYAVTREGWEFRCSLHLSGYSLENVGSKKLHKYHCEKLVGELDYDKIRTPETPLTPQEIDYCINDVKVVCAYIQEEIERNNNSIAEIPLTKTGYVRRYAREACFSNKFRYQSLMRELVVTPQEFELLHRAFQGGFTHSNPAHTYSPEIDDGNIQYNVDGVDIASSYPSQMAANRFPMGRGKLINLNGDKKLFQRLLKEYHCIFELHLWGVHSKFYFDNYISESKCFRRDKCFSQNGRIVLGEYIATVVTEIDFQLILTGYSFDKIMVGNLYIYESDYLPTDFIHAMLTLYQRKTELKGVEGMEYEYSKIKEDQNSFYGMTVTSPIRDIIEYTDKWEPSRKPELVEAIKEYNSNHERFLFYPWGIYTTAYARKSIWAAILETRDDHIYSDTDSEKLLNWNNHKDFFEKYNANIQQRLKQACLCHGLDFESLCRPKNKKGVAKPLGVFEHECKYKRFKTLGAKRYMYEVYTDERGTPVTYETKHSKIEFVVAGLKKSAVKWMCKNNEDPFDAFNENLIVPRGESGRITHTYINEERSGYITDYLGNKYLYHTLSGLHMEPSEYSLSMTEDYMDYLAGRIELNITD